MTFTVRSAYRDLKDHKQPPFVKAWLHLDGSGTLEELVELLDQRAPHAHAADVTLTVNHLYWREEPTQADLDERAAWRARYEEKNRERTERWERETYLRLKAQFEGEPPPDAPA